MNAEFPNEAFIFSFKSNRIKQNQNKIIKLAENVTFITLNIELKSQSIGQ